MPMKDWFTLLPKRLTVALVVSVLGLCVRMAAVQMTHSLTVLVDTSYALCRFIALISCGFAVKATRKEADVGFEAERKLRNTFGWARVEVLAMLVVHVLFASFSFALLLEALQHAVHASHGDPPHAPVIQLVNGIGGAVLSGINYLLLRGDVTASDRKMMLTEGGGVVLKNGTRPTINLTFGISDFVMRSAGLLLLQTVPSGMDTSVLRAEVLRVRGVRALRELHVWQLAPGHIVATAHVYYDSPEDFKTYSDDVAGVFAGRGIRTVALQPEFDEERPPCVPACRGPRCCRPESPPAQTEDLADNDNSSDNVTADSPLTRPVENL